MKAVLCKSYGPPENLVVEDIPEPLPAAGEVIVAVAAAALNFFDTLIIAGRYQYKPVLPFSPSAECAGRIVALGPDVAGWEIGERVIAHLGWGCCRERIAVPTSRIVRIPEQLSDEQAAGLTVTYGTGIHALADRASLKPGETLAVLGAAGGTGLAAIELGRIMSARVIACASSEDKLAVARQHGAHETLDYGAHDLKEGLRRLTGGNGVDVVYDPVGGAFSEPAVRALAWQGRHLVVGFAAGDIPRLPLNLLLLKGCDLRGVFWGAFIEREPERHRAHMANLVAWAADGRLKAHVHAAFPLERTAEALGVIARRQAVGKVIITTG
jgi:NADPH2:quinone reductase